MSNTTRASNARSSNGRFAKKQTVIDAESIESAEPPDVGAKFAAFNQLFGLPPDFVIPRFPIAGFITNIAVCALGGYAAGYLASYLAVGCLVLSGSAFLAICVYVLGLVAGILAAMRAGAIAGRYVSTGQFENDYQSAKGWVVGKARSIGGLFRRNTVEA